MKVLITGGCGFIGSHVVTHAVEAGWDVTNLDKLTYAANQDNVASVADAPNYRFVQADICDAALVRELVAGMDLVINFAAETHVDRSLIDPAVFARTDVEGVVSLLEAVRADGRALLVHMSTDEVFGSLDAPEEAAEDHPFAPTSPYSASKAAAELMLRAYAESYAMPVTVLRSCNVYGPRQHREKFIPLFITRALQHEALPLYGDGLQQREWIYVEDLVRAIRSVIDQLPSSGLHAWNVGSGERIPNIEVARDICELTERPAALIQPVKDRPGHDRRYAVNSSKLRTIGWALEVPFEAGIARTVAWYMAQSDPGADQSFNNWLDVQYKHRLDESRLA